MTSTNSLAPVAVFGPTASGKSALGLELAHRLGGEVVNVDSMQLYRGMDIGTAKLSPEEREGVPHHQIDVLDVTDAASVAAYQEHAVADVEAIMARGRVPILVGGSMMYAQALVDDWHFPPTDPKVRRRWYERLDEVGIDELHRELAERDPEAAAKIEDRDPRRTVRALEVIELTGKPFKASQPPKEAPPRWGTRLFALEAPGEWLRPRIARRTQGMLEQGLVEETEGLIERGLERDSTAGRAIGYAQVLDHLAGQLPGEELGERIEMATRRYVRRQRSWFRRDPRITWLPAAENPAERALDLLA
ncbi:tRNA (adenosine(37)-N6)-dimethylallyltransferase MiaA [Corynebacterium otitidis]|mgnify:FL=1|uniref:tRNA dimethylallyltransferase n=1 Tax=Corynebacterium otitidis ATCC 51513 TaxID=883169 RepID=I7KIV7_9CORY|nr:tRNA (adenosine(37)-N6)-dimethylallyltransferase MiaA [Corynebacterium otitidis]EJZ83022.1 tRNA dimethylallyltransferase [Corynebacterium otitidis ATCC 51513]KKO83943.1 tRNA delta(2)-isopentenylpyrophosphate transferase [Corynebacterium otitidis]CCI83165.1 tRNA delta(2)-isopentenylpyrophosphate transferase [Corynebacterium otitidis ATCC 51513]